MFGAASVVVNAAVVRVDTAQWILCALEVLTIAAVTLVPHLRYRPTIGDWPATFSVRSPRRSARNMTLIVIPIFALEVVLPVVLGQHRSAPGVWSGMLLGFAVSYGLRFELLRRFERRHGVVVYEQLGRLPTGQLTRAWALPAAEQRTEPDASVASRA